MLVPLSRAVELCQSSLYVVAKTRGEVMMVAADTVLSPNQMADVRFIPDRRLIRAGLLMLLFMTAAFGAATWNAVQDLASQVKAVPVVLFVIVCVLVARLYTKVDEIAAAPALAVPVRSATPLQITTVAQVPLETRDEIWKYWDKSGTGKREIEEVRSTYGVAANVVLHLLEHYDARWREQVAMLCCDNPENEYTAYISADGNQAAEDALRLKSGLPIYPVAGVWLCSDCRKRPCQCE